MAEYVMMLACFIEACFRLESGTFKPILKKIIKYYDFLLIF